MGSKVVYLPICEEVDEYGLDSPQGLINLNFI
jgi:hypothetical protein